jgi:hypothetical protein
MIPFRRVLLVVVLAVSCSRIIAQDEEDTGGSTTTATATEVGESTPTTTTSVSDKTSPSSPPCNENDWGSFYDPNNIFCGKYDCYKILCFDYETWVSSDPPTLKAITKSYRNLSRKWHPDKNKAKGAREKFVVSTTIYQIYKSYTDLMSLVLILYLILLIPPCACNFHHHFHFNPHPLPHQSQRP